MFTLVFGMLVALAVAISFATRDWRLRTVATSCGVLWATTAFVVPLLPTTAWVDPIYTIILFVMLVSIQARGAVERARGEPLAMWLLVPMGIESVIAVSYLAEPWILSPVAQLRLIQLGFAAELICIIVVGGRRLRLGRRLREAIGEVAALSIWSRPGIVRN